ncbi:MULTISPECIES: hypothetical protein [unclassified Streptomyces]|uniref:hypothetical protein n=1 Tax=unclassified Streptomyces TaxID=2593676 RepID=UPI00331F3DA5
MAEDSTPGGPAPAFELRRGALHLTIRHIPGWLVGLTVSAVSSAAARLAARYLTGA